MFEFLQHIDTAILQRVESGCHWLQRTFGIRSRLLARTCGILLIVNQAFVRGWAALVMATLVFVLDETSWMLTPTTRDFANHRKISYWGIRLIDLMFLTTWGVVDIMFVGSFWWACVTMRDYLNAVDDLPSGESRVKKWLKSLQPTPAPVPVFSQCLALRQAAPFRVRRNAR